MGVRKLQSYLEKFCQSACPTVDIADIVDEARRRNPIDEEVVIVVDGSSCIRILYAELEWIGGGQLNQFAEKTQYFVQAFESIGVRLVFYFDGPTINKKRKEWVKRRMDALDKMYYVLDKISEGTPSDNIDRRRYFHLPPGLGQLSRIIFENICECEVHQSLTECDEEIAEYARTHNVFAILGQDTDFVILDKGDAIYLSMERLNLDNMTTVQYDHTQLAYNLKLHPSQLPLLATLMGNDVVPLEDLENFQRAIIKQHNTNPFINVKFLVPNLAMYIRRLPLDWNDLYASLPDVAYQVFRNSARADDIWTSMNSYVPQRDDNQDQRHRNDNWSLLVAEARRRHQNNETPSMVYAIMKGLPFESSTSIEDFRLQDLPSFASATLLIRRRIYGILLQEKSLPQSGQHKVAEWCMAGPGSLDRANYESAIPPSRRHPGLLKLWNDTAGRLLNIRWQLFVETVSPDLDVERVRHTVPTYLVLPTLILFYLKKLNCLHEWEIKAALATAVCLKHYDVMKLRSLPSDPMDTRGIRFANLFMRSTFVLYILLAACGYPLTVQQTSAWLFFDGKLFQIKYLRAKARDSILQLCEHKGDVIEDFQKAYHIVFSATAH